MLTFHSNRPIMGQEIKGKKHWNTSQGTSSLKAWLKSLTDTPLYPPGVFSADPAAGPVPHHQSSAPNYKVNDKVTKWLLITLFSDDENVENPGLKTTYFWNAYFF